MKTVGRMLQDFIEKIKSKIEGNKINVVKKHKYQMD